MDEFDFYGEIITAPPNRLLLVQYADQLDRFKTCFNEWDVIVWDAEPPKPLYDFILIGFEPSRNTLAKWTRIDTLRDTRLAPGGKVFQLD